MLSFSAAAAAGIDVDWGERCDTTTGRLAVVDYFASECYAPFTGDNGGETDQGVTADTVKIVFYQGPEDDFIIRYITDALSIDETNQQEADTVRGMIDYYEAYYETYGRSVELIPYESSGIANDEVTARADAVRIAEEFQPFMVWGGPALTNAFADELAARGVQCIACTPAQPPDWYAERDPFVFGIDASGNQKQSHTAELILQAARRQAGRVRRRRRPLDGAAVRPGVRGVERQLEAAGRRVHRNARGGRCRRRRDGLVRARPDVDPAGGVAGDRQDEGRRCDHRAVEHRSDRAPRLHPRGHGPAVLPRVGPGSRHAHRHDRLRPDVRPGAVGARVRQHGPGGAHRPREQRLLPPVPVVQRRAAAGARPDRRARPVPGGVLRRAPRRRARSDEGDAGPTR